MTLFLRCLKAFILGLFQERLAHVTDPVEMVFRVWPIDIDLLRHMNNAKYLNYMQAGRLLLQVRTGFLWAGLKQGWIAPVSKVEIEFHRPLRLFQKFSLTTEISKAEKNFLTIDQTFNSRGKRIASARVTVAIRKAKAVVAPKEYLGMLGYEVP